MTVGPYPKPWPSGPQYDASLLEEGDTRNVVDRYRYWTREAIVADLDQQQKFIVIQILRIIYQKTIQIYHLKKNIFKVHLKFI